MMFVRFFANRVHRSARGYAMFLAITLVLIVGTTLGQAVGLIDAEEQVASPEERSASIALLRDESFLPQTAAACVVDQAFADTGSLYPAGDSKQWLTEGRDAVAACIEHSLSLSTE